MEKVKDSKDYTVFKKRSGRYAVKGADGKWINGADKVKVLTSEDLIAKMNPPKKKEEPQEAAPQAEAPADTTEETPSADEGEEETKED